MEDLFKKRLERNMVNLKKTYFKVYKELGATDKDFDLLVSMMNERFNERKSELRELDKRDSKWYMSKDMVGMMIYTDLFAGDFKKLQDKISYLNELGITYVHLMPLLKPRKGENDGGYAVEDYLDIDHRLGTDNDFKILLDKFREAGIDVCIDYVLNHTADTHEFAKKALCGDKKYQDMFYMYDNRNIPDEYDKTVPEVLPDKCPGNFTYSSEIGKWIFTSFSDFQWDLNFKNHYVFERMTDILLKLANKGINIIRLDAIPFMWKELGTMCRNLAPIHDLIYMLNIIKDIVCPSLALLGEAIVEPHEIIKYFGTDERPECGILYNANFMVNVWNAFATRDARLINIDNNQFKVPKTGCWMNYIRCHDDIGWGFNEQAISSFGMDPYSHKQFLIDFYSGEFQGSFAMGELYQYNPINHDARINGTCASLLGLEQSIGDNFKYGEEIAIKRVLLAHAMVMAHRGIPLIYSGDEIATLNDQSYKNDHDKKEEGRWVHRPFFDWERAKNRKNLVTPEGKVFTGIKKLIEIRKEHSLFNGDLEVNVIDTYNKHIYAFYKQEGNEKLICLFNFCETEQAISTRYFNEILTSTLLQDIVEERTIDFSRDKIRLAPYEFLWLK